MGPEFVIDKALIEGESFKRFFSAHQKLVYCAAYSITQNAEDADDVVQTVFLTLLKHWDPTQLAGNIKGYLYRAEA